MDKKDIKILIVSLAVLSQYNTKIYLQIPGEEPEVKDLTLQDVADFEESLKQGVDVQIKPYLRPMSSMTEDEIKEFILIADTVLWLGDKRSTCILSLKQMDWLNAHHFDYRGLIPKGLALEAPEGMY